MGYQEIEIRVSVYSNASELKNIIRKKVRLENFTFHILRKGLDARNKRNISWLYRIGILSEEIKSGNPPEISNLPIDYRKREKRITVVGAGPAGIFSSLYLAQNGFRVTLLERGNKVEQRKSDLEVFETSGIFCEKNNYAFGEGGAGTFSDGKLTSRTKSIKAERNYIYHQLIEHGAPDEIFYMTHPHLGTDNLFRITQNIGGKLEQHGVDLKFDTQLLELRIRNNRVSSIITNRGQLESDYYLFATGHSAFDTYRMLIKAGVSFETKNFALGCRVEHPQQIINQGQWGVGEIPGIKAAEYRLSAESSDKTPVYSFCMCPGGKIVPAAAFKNTNIVNGMSYYSRNSQWANAAVVAGVNLEKILNRSVSALEALDWLENIEQSFYNLKSNYSAPACSIQEFIDGKPSLKLPPSSYPFDLFEADFHDLFPGHLIHPLKQGLANFSRKIKGYNQGIMVGLESKTSSVVQAQREKNSSSAGVNNLFIAGEGSGWAGGIVSSAADGLKVAQQIMSLR